MQKRVLIFLPLIFLAPLLVQAADLSADCKELFPGHNNPNENRLNFVFIGMNYATEEEFLTQIPSRFSLTNLEMNKNVLGYEPYKSNLEKINFWYVSKIGNPAKLPGIGEGAPTPELMDALKEDRKCPVSNEIDLVFVNAIFRPHVNAIVQESRPGEMFLSVLSGRADPSYPNTIVHELGHVFGFREEYLAAAPVLNTTNLLPSDNCGGTSNQIACPLWCKGPMLSMVPFKNFDCSQYADIVSCTTQESSCTWIEPNYPILGKSGCVNLVNLCGEQTTQETCTAAKNSFYLFSHCTWLKNAPNPFYKTQCIPSDNQQFNIGTECVEGTGCYPGCDVPHLYRSTKKSIMAVGGAEYGTYDTYLICRKMSELTSGNVGGKCSELFALFTGFAIAQPTHANNATNQTNSTNASVTSTTIFSPCSLTQDEICPQECGPAADVDCCSAKGACWYNGLCDDCNAQSNVCSPTLDNSCPSTCSVGADADCCKQAGRCWKKGVCDVCSVSTKPAAPSAILVPTAPNLVAESNEAGGVFLTWTRSQLIEQQLTGNIALKRVSKNLNINIITGNAGFIDTILNIFKSIFGGEEKGINIVSPETQGIRYKVYRNNNLLAEGSDELCSDICQYVDEAGRSGLFSYKVEACLQDSCRDSNEINLEIVITSSSPKPTTLPEEESPREIPATPATSPNGTDIPPTTPSIITPSLCSTTPDNSCPSACSAGSDYDCCKTAGKCWFYSGVDRAGCYECTITTGFCSIVSDGVCPSGCVAGADADCCSMAGKCWFSSYGCYDCNQNPGSCTSTEDGLCPSSCTAGSDADCCSQSGMCWIEGKGCAFGFCSFTATPTTLQSVGPSGSSGSSGGTTTPSSNETTTTLSSGTAASTSSTTTSTTTTTIQPGSSCENSGDGVCPSTCSAGSDYDCCRAKGPCWDWFENNNGCQSTC